MRCTECAATFYSAAARTLVARGERCAECGGELLLVPLEPPVAVTGAGEDRPGLGAGAERAGRRFTRE